KLKLQGDADALQSIIQQPEILVASGFAKELQTEQMESAAREFTRSAQVGVDIGETHGKKGVVLANCGAQEQRLLMVQAESKARKVARLGVKQAEVGGAEMLDVAVAIEDGEGVAVLEYTSTIIR